MSNWKPADTCRVIRAFGDALYDKLEEARVAHQSDTPLDRRLSLERRTVLLGLIAEYEQDVSRYLPDIATEEP